MERLKNSELLVGRSPEDSKMLIAIRLGDEYKTIALGEAGSVPQSVSRCRPDQDKAHCKLSIDGAGNIQVINSNPNNITYVGGVQISRKNVQINDTIALGDGSYAIDVNQIMSAVLPLFGFSLKHLEKVWSDYEKKLALIERRVKMRTTKRLVAMSLTGVLSAVSATLFKTDAGATSEIISLVITLISSLYMLKIVLEKDTSQEDKAKARDELFQKYRCPNPECNHFFGYGYEYRMLKEIHSCPHCRVKYSD